MHLLQQKIKRPSKTQLFAQERRSVAHCDGTVLHRFDICLSRSKGQ